MARGLLSTALPTPLAIWYKDGRYYLLTGSLLVLKEFGEKRQQPEHLGDTRPLRLG